MSALAIVAKVRRLQRMQAAARPKALPKTIQIQAPTADLDRWADDFPWFAALLDIIPKGGQRTKLRPNAIQAAFEVSRTGRDIVLKPRQVGLTTWELARDVWFFLTRRGARVVVVCQSMADDAAIHELAGKLSVMFESLRSAGVVIPGLDASTTKWTLPSRDASLRIIGAGASEASAQKKGRSGTIHRLHVTELAFFEFAGATMNALLECVPDDPLSEIVLESTANGASGYFFTAYQDGKDRKASYRAHFFSWMKQKEYATALEPGERILPETDRERAIVKAGATPEQLKWYRKKVADKKDQDLVDQEYPLDEDTCWLSIGRLFFDKEKTKALRGDARRPIETIEVGAEGSHGVLRIWKHRQPGRRYVVAGDPSEGVGGDPGAAVVLDRGTGEHVATLHGQFTTWEMARLVAEFGRGFSFDKEGKRRASVDFHYVGPEGPALIVVERNNHGHAVIQGLIREQRYTNVFIGHDKRPGWVNSEVSRAAALAAMQSAFKDGHWVSPEKETHSEMLKFVVLASGRAEAAPGAHDDLILAHAIGWDVCCMPNVERHAPTGFVP